MDNADLELVTGGKTYNKFLASYLAGLVLMFSGSTVGAISPNVPQSSDSIVASQVIAELTKQQAIEDIDYVINTIKQFHVSCIDHVPQEVIDQKEIELRNLPERLNTFEEWRIICRILAKFHDAHTIVACPSSFICEILPFTIEVTDDKFFCKSGEFEGSEIVKIDDKNIVDLYEVFRIH